MDNKELSPEAKLAVQTMKMNMAAIILNLPDEYLWRVVSSMISAQVQAAVEKAKEAENEQDS